MKNKYLALSSLIVLSGLLAGTALACEDSDGQGGRRGPPPEAISACDGAAVDDACEFDGRRGTLSGTCQEVRDGFACVPEHHRRAPADSEEGAA